MTGTGPQLGLGFGPPPGADAPSRAAAGGRPAPSAPSLVTGELTEILTPPQVAKRAGWSRKRMWAYLVELNRRYDGLLLVNVSQGKKRPRWTVSMQSLKLLNAPWFQDPESLQRQIDEHGAKLVELEARLVSAEKTQKYQGATLAALKPTGT